MNHPDDVPTSLTRRAYALRDVTLSQNQYAAVVADAYEDIKRHALREAAEKIRHHIMANQSLANWQRHILYGVAGETFEAQEALDKFEAALQAMYADLIDPDKEN